MCTCRRRLVMETFEEILEQYEPMISSIIRKLNIYKNYDSFRQTARIALWQAWLNFDEAKGKFSNYAYTTIKTTLLKEMTKENRYSYVQIAWERDDLTNAAHHYQMKNNTVQEVVLFEEIEELLTDDELALLLDLYFFGYSYEALAEKHGIAISTLKKRRQRLMEKIRKQLNE